MGKIIKSNQNKLQYFFEKLDLFSKILIFLFLFILIYLTYFYFSNRATSEPLNQIVEVDINPDLKVADYVFETRTKVRWPEDTFIVFSFTKILSEEDKKNLEFRILPAQGFSLSYFNNEAILKFNEPSPKDALNRDIIVLYKGKQIERIRYFTSDIPSPMPQYVEDFPEEGDIQ